MFTLLDCVDNITHLCSVDTKAHLQEWCRWARGMSPLLAQTQAVACHTQHGNTCNPRGALRCAILNHGWQSWAGLVLAKRACDTSAAWALFDASPLENNAWLGGSAQRLQSRTLATPSSQPISMAHSCGVAGTSRSTPAVAVSGSYYCEGKKGISNRDYHGSEIFGFWGLGLCGS